MIETPTFGELMLLPKGEQQQRLEALRARSRELEAEVFDVRVNAHLGPLLDRILVLEDHVTESCGKQTQQ